MFHPPAFTLHSPPNPGILASIPSKPFHPNVDPEWGCIKQPPNRMRSSLLPLDGFNQAKVGRAWLTSQSRGGELRVWRNQYAFLSSLRALCLSLAITVCHATERRGHTISSHASLHPGHDGTPLPHMVTTSKGRHVILLSLHGAKKAPVTLPRALYSSSGHRSAEPSPPFIYLLIRLPVLAPFCLTLCLYHLSVCSRRIPQWLLFEINMLCNSLLRK